MKQLFSKPLFWSNVAAFLATGLVTAGVAMAWNNPSAGPTTANGAISVSNLGNVGIGVAPDAMAKLHIGGDLLVDNGITLGGLKRTSWLANGSSIDCSETGTTYAFSLCQVAATDKVYAVYSYNSGTGIVVLIGSVATPGVTPYSTITCGGTSTTYAYSLCQVAATDKVYSVYAYNSGTGIVALAGSSAAVGVTPLSPIRCGATNTTYAYSLCQIGADDKVYSVYAYNSGTGIVSIIGSAAAPGVIGPK